MDVVQQLREEGWRFLERAVSDKDTFYALYEKLNTEKNDSALHEALVALLVNHGHKRLEERKTGKETTPSLAVWLRDKERTDRLYELLLTPQGIRAVVDAAGTPSGEYLLLEPMSVDYPAAHALVNRLLVAKNGRNLVISVVEAAAGNEVEKSLVPKFSRTPVSDGKQRAVGWTNDRAEDVVEFFKTHEQEALAILHDTLQDDSVVEKLVQFLPTEKGRMLAARIGKTGFGRKYGGGYLWFTPGGRALVKKLLSSFEGHEAVYAIMTGMTRAEFIAGTAPLG